jgi:lipoprotein-releasing system permease protein
MNGFERELKDKVLGFTSHVTAYSNHEANSDYTIFDNFIENGEISGYSPYIEKQVLLTSKNATAHSLMRAVNPTLEKNVGYIHENIIAGKYDDLSNIKQSIIIGSGVAYTLNVNVGDEINLFTQFKHSSTNKMIQFKENYRVAGIFDVGIYEYNNVYAFINIDDFLTSLEANNKRDIYIKTIRIKLPDPLKSKLFTYKFNREIDGYYTQDWSYTHESLFSAINNEKRVMFIILMLIIAIAAFNIVSSLLMLVTNKQKEIAILVTLGATRFDIITIFLLQGLFLGSIGIFFGVLLGFLLASNIDVIISSIEIFFKINLMPAEIYHLNKIPSLINHDDIIFIVIYTFLLTFVSAIYPAIKASKIKPAKIFRGNN